MRMHLAVIAVAMVIPAIASAQASDGGGPSSRRADAMEARDTEDQAQRSQAIARRQRLRSAWIPPRASVMQNGKHWVGPTYSDRDLQLDRPWQRGRFRRGIGPNYVWLLEGGTRERFLLGGAWFSLAPADHERGRDWRWNNDHVVLYPDPAHDGWYRAYNLRLEAYTHVMYLGGAIDRASPAYRRGAGLAPSRASSSPTRRISSP